MNTQNITEYQYIDIVKEAFYFLSNFPYIKDFLAELDENPAMQQHYYNYYCNCLALANNRSELAILMLYYNLDKEHTNKFALLIAKHYGEKLQK